MAPFVYLYFPRISRRPGCGRVGEATQEFFRSAASISSYPASPSFVKRARTTVADSPPCSARRLISLSIVRFVRFNFFGGGDAVQNQFRLHVFHGSVPLARANRRPVHLHRSSGPRLAAPANEWRVPAAHPFDAPPVPRVQGIHLWRQISPTFFARDFAIWCSRSGNQLFFDFRAQVGEGSSIRSRPSRNSSFNSGNFFSLMAVTSAT